MERRRAARRKTEQLPYARPKASRRTAAGRQDHRQRRFSPRLVVQPHTDSAPPSSVSSLAPQEIKKQSDSPRYPSVTPFLKSFSLNSRRMIRFHRCPETTGSYTRTLTCSLA